MKSFQYFFIFFLMITHLMSAEPDSLLSKGRTFFYLAVDNKDDLIEAENIFTSLKSHETLKGRATVYLGALKALHGKHAFIPIQKYTKTKSGLIMMDEGIMMNPADIESRFIRGMTCFYLPFFFKRKKTAQEDFRYVIDHMPEQYIQYAPEVILNVIAFIHENIELTKQEQQQLEMIQTDLSDSQ